MGNCKCNLRLAEDGVVQACCVDLLDFRGANVTVSGVQGCQAIVTIDFGLNIQIDDCILWFYDECRNKWLSSSRMTANAGRKGRIKNAYLRLTDGQTSNLTGWRMPRDATIVSVSAHTRNAETWTLKLRKNGVATDIGSLSIVSADGDHDTDIDIDLDEGEQLQFFADTTAFLGIKDPMVWVEVAWRNDSLSSP